MKEELPEVHGALEMFKVVQRPNGVKVEAIQNRLVCPTMPFSERLVGYGSLFHTGQQRHHSAVILLEWLARAEGSVAPVWREMHPSSAAGIKDLFVCQGVCILVLDLYCTVLFCTVLYSRQGLGQDATASTSLY
jgi:hypothetical protein